MPFEPATTLLNTLDEFKNLSHTITYIGYIGSVGTSYPVTITALDDNDTINVSGNTISGFYSNSFDDFIHYRNKDDTFTTVNNRIVNMGVVCDLETHKDVFIFISFQGTYPL